MATFDFDRMLANYDAVSSIANAGNAIDNAGNAFGGSGELLNQARIAPQNGIDQQDSGMREMTGTERLFASLADLSHNIANSQRFGEYYQENGGLKSLLSPEGAARFAMNLPTGMASALPGGIANLYAAGSGSNVTYGADVANNMIQEKELDAGQRAASAVTGLIDTAGLAFGGSGSLINEFGRAMKAGRSVDAAARTGAGLNIFRGTGSSLANRGALTTGQAFAFDVAEEAGEEFVQSLSEDVIQEQLNDGSLQRAFEGAVMGAAGGGLMSGAALGMRSLTNESIDKATKPPSQPEDKNVFGWYNEVNANNLENGVSRATGGMSELARDESLKEYLKKKPGSASAMFKSTGTYQGFDDLGLTILEIRNIANQSQDSYNSVLDWVNGGDRANGFVTPQQLNNWLLNNNDTSAREMWDKLQEVYGDNEIRIALERNPGTSEGIVWARVKGIRPGKGIDLSPHLAKAVGGDYDSDRGAVFFDITKAQMNPITWASDLLQRNEDQSGASPSTKYDFDFTSMVYATDKDQRSHQRDTVTDRLTDLTRTYSGGVGNTALVDNVVNDLFNAYEITDNDARNVAIAQALTRLKQQFDSTYGADGSGRAGRDAVSTVFEAFADYYVPQSADALAKTAAREAFDRVVSLISRDAGSGSVPTPGSSTSTGTAFSSFEVGMPDWFTAENLQQFYRSYATAIYQNAKDNALSQQMFSETYDVHGVQISAWGMAIIEGAKLVTAGTDPSDAIVEITSELIRIEYSKALGDAHLATSDPATIEERVKKFEEIYQKWAKVKNDSMKQLRGELYMTPAGTAEWNESLTFKGNRSQFCSEYLRIFGSNAGSELIPSEYFGNGSSSFADQLKDLNSIVLDVAQHGLSAGSLIVMSNKDEGDYSLYNLFMGLVEAVKSEGPRTTAAAKEILGEVDLRGLMQRYVAGEDLRPEDIAAWMKYSEVLESLANKKAWMYAGLIDPKNWINTAIGRKLTSTDVDDRLTAIVAANFLGKFRDALAFRANPANNGKQFDDKIENKLEELANIDILHRQIVNELRSEGTENEGRARSDTLERLLDLDITFDEKERWITNVLGAEDGTMSGSLLLSSMQSAVEEDVLYLDKSTSTQIRQARTAASEYKMLLWDNAVAEVEELKTYVKQLQNQEVFRTVFYEQCAKAVTSISLDPLCAMIADGANFSNHQPEKGVTIYSSSHYYVQVDFAENGNQTSFLTDKFSTPLGTALLEDVLSNPQIILRLLSDPDISLRVFASDGRNCILTRDDVYEHVCGANYQRKVGPTVDNTLELLSAYPTLVTYLGGIDTSSRDGSGGPRDVKSRQNTLLNLMKNEAKRRNDNREGNVEKHAFDLQIEKIKNALLGDMRTASYVFSCLSPETKTNVERGFKPSKAEVDGILTRMAKGIYAERARAYTQDGKQLIGASVDRFNQNFRTGFLERMQKFASLVDQGIARNASQALRYADDIKAQREENFVMEELFVTLLEDYGDEAGLDLGPYPVDLAAAKASRGLGKLTSISGLTNPSDLMLLYYSLSSMIVGEALFTDVEVLKNSLRTLVSSWVGEEGISLKPNETIDSVAEKIATRIAGDNGRYGEINDLLIPVNERLFDENGNKLGEDALNEVLAHISKVCNDEGSSDEAYRNAELKKRFDALPDNAQTQDYLSFTLLINSAIVNRVVNNYQENIAGSANAAIVRDYANAYDYVRSFISDPRYLGLFDNDELIRSQHLEKYLHNRGYDGAIDDFPIPDYSDRKAALYARQLVEIASSGRVLTEVGRNGMENAELFGIDIVPLKPLPFVTGEVTTWGDLKARQQANIDRRYVRKLENGQPTDDQPITIGELKALQQGPADTDQYELFDPKINPHGVHLGPLMAPAMGAYANGYKGIIAALNRMQMESMEEMVLKVRKAFGKNGDFTLVRIRDNGSTRRDGLNNLKANRISTTDAARKAYEEFVEAATDVIANSSLYTPELKGIGIGRDEFRALVQMMTPAIDVHYVENGQHKHKLIDVMHLYSGDYETELKKIPGEIKDAEVFNVTLQVAARKVEDGVITVGNDMTNEEFSQAAYDQMTNWDDFESGTLGIGEVLAQVPALGRSYNNLHAEGDMTAFQSMYKKVMGVEFPNFSREMPASFYNQSRWSETIKEYSSDTNTMSESEKSHWNARESVSRQLRNVSGSLVKNAAYGVQEEGQPVSVCRVFGSDYSWAKGDSISATLKDALKTLSDNNWVAENDNVLLLSSDNKVLDNAIAFAVAAKKNILMPVSLYGGYDADLQHTTLSFEPYSGVKPVIKEFVVIPYDAMIVAPHARFSASRARIQRINPQTFYNTILLDDRGEFPGIGDSVTRFLVSAAKKLGTWNAGDTRTVNLSSYIKPNERANYGFSLIDESDIASLKDISVTDNAAWEKFDEAIKQFDRSEHESTPRQGGVSRLNGYRREIKNCLEDMSKNVAKGRGATRELAGKEGGDCATIIKVTDRSGSVVRYIPVIIPKNVGKIDSGYVMYSNGTSNVGISYVEKVDYTVNGYAKWNIATEAAVKSVLSFVNDLGRSGCEGFDGVTNFSTLSSRLKGRDTSVAYTNIHRKMVQEYMHFLFEYNKATDKVELASWMRNRDAQYITNTINGVTSENSLWAEILAGQLPPGLTEVEDQDNLGRVLRKVITQATRHGINVMTVFGAGNFSVNLKDGPDKFKISIAEEQDVPDIAMAFDGLSYGDVIDFFSYIGQNQAKPLVQFRNDPQEAGEKSNFIFDKTGKMQVKIGDRICYRRVFVGPVQYMGHASGVDTPGNEATVSIQQRNNKIAMYGIDSSAVGYAAAYARWHRMDPEAFNITRDVNLNNIVDLGFDALNISGPLFDSWEEANNLATLRDRADAALRWRRKIVKNDGSGEIVNIMKDDDRIKTAIEDFGKKIGWKKGVIPIGLVHYLVNAKDGSTEGNLENQTIKAGRFIDLLEEIAEDYKKSGNRTLIWQDPDAISSDRIALPVLDESVVDYICNNTDMKKADYVEAMWESEANSLNCIQALTDPKYGAKQAELRAQSAANRLGWNDAQHPWNDVGYLFAGVTIDDIKRSDGLWSKFLKAKGFDEEGFNKLSEYGQTLLKDQYKKLHLEDTRKLLESDKFLGAIGRSGKSVQTSDQVTKVMRNTISLSRLMAVANPGVAIGNLAGRATSQSAMELFLSIGARYKIGPMAYGAENALSSDVMTKINQDEALHKTWNTLRKISLLGDDLEAISKATSSAKLLEELDKVTANQTTFQKFATRGFDFANGGEFLTKQQTRLFFKRLVQFMSAEPALNVYFQKVPDAEGNLTDMTLIEREILSNPSAFLLDCFNKGGRPELYACAQQAMNSALTGDMAQRHFLASWLHHLASQTTFGDFILSTTICKFPKYQFNLVGKYMNWFAPMSTTYMLLTRAAQKIDEKIAEHSEKTGGNYTPYHFELDQRFVNIREAMAYDMTHMGAAPLAAILAMLGNAFEPPDDEKKWGDPDEWLFCGARVGESWWLTDMLGAFIPSILWIRSCIEGNPTSALLVNGTMSACYGNPFLRAADCVNVLLDWDDGTLMDYQHTAELYKDAEGGAPGFLDWVQSNAAAGLANWATSLVTPSIVKEIYRNSEAYERSYNRVYQTTNSGKLSEAGEAGYTEKTNYQDAMLRKFCRSNPLMAVALDLLHPGAPTGYLLSEMPYTIYTDPSQAEQAKAWSVSGKDEKEADALMWEIFYYMDARTPEEMQSSGFFLDKETLYAFGSWLWDAYYRIEDEWTKRGANGELSYTVLGNGDYEKGKQVYNELLNDKKQSKQKFYDMYYDKVRGSYLNKGMQTYRRYATSYRTDSEGNLYATGFRRQGVLPFLSAPGTLTDPEGTAGYENDFKSISPVTGQPMGERALVAVESESMDLPAFEGFSAKGDGNGYSGKWSNYAKYESPTTTYTPSGYRGGGGGSSRRSSGSSNQYVPGISSRNYTPNIPNAATARTTRVYDTQFDYLRPGVETKGSRDAYKRGDI